jgi:hypothetical protein
MIGIQGSLVTNEPRARLDLGARVLLQLVRARRPPSENLAPQRWRVWTMTTALVLSGAASGRSAATASVRRHEWNILVAV